MAGYKNHLHTDLWVEITPPLRKHMVIIQSSLTMFPKNETEKTFSCVEIDICTFSREATKEFRWDYIALVPP